ncbi:winged helix-turn-helix domain-containing protein [Salinimicrobium soli]|uniref:winged helix-turn-helix domain-containing protein n=1 Tax=Salinimicrobium soli TaxID=1254399 RepID=UPI003AB086AE
MKNKVTWKEAIKMVLKEAKRPLHYSEIAKTIVKNKYKMTTGLTPRKTVYTSLKRMLEKKDSEISQRDRGVFSFKKRKG